MKFNINKKSKKLDGFIKVESLNITHDKFDGGQLTVIRDIIKGNDASHVLIFDPKNKQILMISQFRTGLIDTDNAWSLEAVAGLIDAGETPLQAAIRETREETGLIIPKENFTFVNSAHPSFGDCNKKSHIFIAETDLSILDTSVNHGEATESEDIQLILLSFDDLLYKFKNRELLQIQDIISVQYLILEHIIKL